MSITETDLSLSLVGYPGPRLVSVYCIGPVQNWGPANLCTLPYAPKPREVVVYVAGDQILDIQLSDITNQTKQTLKLLLPGISSQRFVRRSVDRQ